MVVGKVGIGGGKVGIGGGKGVGMVVGMVVGKVGIGGGKGGGTGGGMGAVYVGKPRVGPNVPFFRMIDRLCTYNAISVQRIAYGII